MKEQLDNQLKESVNRQQPVNSGFGAGATASEVIKDIDLSGKYAIVTGGYSGIGLETVRVLSAAGAQIVVPMRDRAKATAALAGIENVEMEDLELMNPKSIHAFTSKFLATGRPLHILINSAGIMANPLTRDARGYESQFSTNHLGHFQLALQLWPALKQANGARVVSVSSRGHRYSPVVFEDPNYEHRDYDPMKAYGQSKTANILFALELDNRGKASGVRTFSLHPGAIVDTGLSRGVPKEALQKMGVVDGDGKAILDPLRQLKQYSKGHQPVFGVQLAANWTVWAAFIVRIMTSPPY
jgi:NAD(P)-dependent dehydrogenase (short-subunit alcohol dehydrogenase family)